MLVQPSWTQSTSHFMKYIRSCARKISPPDKPFLLQYREENIIYLFRVWFGREYSINAGSEISETRHEGFNKVSLYLLKLKAEVI